jgi:thiol-disulfide isomerase/thioredoxin
MKHLEPSQFDELLSSDEKALVMFYADWCPFCQRFIPIFESVNQARMREHKKTTSYKMYAAKVNDDDNPLWDRFSIDAVPTIVAFDKGKIVLRRDSRLGIGLTKSDVDSILIELAEL